MPGAWCGRSLLWQSMKSSNLSCCCRKIAGVSHAIFMSEIHNDKRNSCTNRSARLSLESCLEKCWEHFVPLPHAGVRHQPAAQSFRITSIASRHVISANAKTLINSPQRGELQ